MSLFEDLPPSRQRGLIGALASKYREECINEVQEKGAKAAATTHCPCEKKFRSEDHNTLAS